MESKANARVEKVRVFARFRPLNEIEEKEIGDSSSSASSTTSDESGRTANSIPYSNEDSLSKYHPLVITPDGINTAVKIGAQDYTFHEVFGVKTQQQLVRSRVLEPLLPHICSGYNASVIAYGQTGSGKTHTMYGPEDDPGLVFGLIDMLSEVKQIITKELKISVMELYNGSLYDLYSADVLTYKSTDAAVQRAIGRIHKDFRWYNVSSFNEVREIVQVTNLRRAVAETKMNRHSSRGHCLIGLQVPLVVKDNKGAKLVATIKLLDLCGSENVGKSGATGAVFQEAVNINTNLFHFRLAVQQINENAVVAFGSDPLLKFMKDSLGGNSLTSVVVCCSPAKLNRRETADTLRFGFSMQNVKNKLVSNEILTHEEALRQLKAAKARILGLEAIVSNLKMLLKQNGISIGNMDKLEEHKDLDDGTTSIRSTSSEAPASRPVSGLFPVLAAAFGNRVSETMNAIEQHIAASSGEMPPAQPVPITTTSVATETDIVIAEKPLLLNAQMQTEPETSTALSSKEAEPKRLSLSATETVFITPESKEPTVSTPVSVPALPPMDPVEDKAMHIDHALQKKEKLRQYMTVDSKTLKQLVNGTTGNQKTFAAISLASSEEWKQLVTIAKEATTLNAHTANASASNSNNNISSQQDPSNRQNNNNSNLAAIVKPKEKEPIVPLSTPDAQLLRAIYRRIAVLAETVGAGKTPT
jgi:hypothetical protein